MKTQNRLYHSCSNTAADLWTMNPGVSNCCIFFNRHATCDHWDLWRKTTLHACEQMLSTTLRWNGKRSVCKRAENINYKVRSLRWSMLEEAHAAHVCCAPDGLFWEIRSSRHRDGSVWVARVERWRKKRNQHKIKRSELNWQRPQGFGKTSGADRGPFDLSWRTSTPHQPMTGPQHNHIKQTPSIAL